MTKVTKPDQSQPTPPNPNQKQRGKYQLRIISHVIFFLKHLCLYTALTIITQQARPNSKKKRKKEKKNPLDEKIRMRDSLRYYIKYVIYYLE